MDLVIPLVVAVFAWLGNQYAQLVNRNVQQKQERYHNILTYLGGLTTSELSADKINAFVTEARLLWLSAPDHVITSVEAFIDTVALSRDDDEKENALGAMIVAMREDTFSRWPLPVVKTELKFSDFKLRGVGPAVTVQPRRQEQIRAGSTEIEFATTLIAHQVTLEQMLRHSGVNIREIEDGIRASIAGYRVEIQGMNTTEDEFKDRVLTKSFSILKQQA